ncbi:hypothetical protein VTI74DRAFT_5606 [Chaetomium olivicolor]
MRLPVRISVVCWAIGLVVLLGYTISRLLFFAHIFYGHAGTAWTQPQIQAIANDSRPASIPKIIHNVFHNWKDPGNDALPSEYAKMRQTCIDLNPDFEFRLWTEKTSRELIEQEYPWFLRTYLGYRYPVQRVDAIKYFIMLHYGGIYMDLDNGCRTNLSPLLRYDVWVTDGDRGALSNNILGARPHHPFYHHLTLALLRYNWNWPLPFVRIMYASGQWFLTAVWEEYHALLPETQELGSNHHLYGLQRILMDGRPGAAEWTFFTHEGGGTWNNWDNQLFWAIGQHLGVFFTVLFVGAAVLGFVGMRCYRRVKARGYVPLAVRPNMSQV